MSKNLQASIGPLESQAESKKNEGDGNIFTTKRDRHSGRCVTPTLRNNNDMSNSPRDTQFIAADKIVQKQDQHRRMISDAGHGFGFRTPPRPSTANHDVNSKNSSDQLSKMSGISSNMMVSCPLSLRTASNIILSPSPRTLSIKQA